MLSLPKRLPAFLWHFIRPYRWQFAAAQACAFGWTLETTIWPYLIKRLVDAMENYQPQMASFASTFAPIFMMLLASYLITGTMFRLLGLCFAWLFPRFEAKVRMTVFDYMLQHSHRFFIDNLAGKLANKIVDITQSPVRIFENVMTLILPTLLSACVATVVFTRINIFLALVFLLWVSTHMGICLYSASRCNALSEAHAQARSTLQGKIVDVIANMASVRIFARRSFEHQNLLPYQRQEQVSQTKSLVYIEKVRLLLQMAATLYIGVIMMGGVILAWGHGLLSLSEALLIISTTSGVTWMAWIAGQELPNLFKEIGICQQALSFVRAEPEVQDAPGAAPLQVKRGEIVFENATFSYAHGRELFQNRSIMIAAGQKVGLVGLSGSGKTSFVQLILRYYDLHAGRILIDGQDIHCVTQASLHEQISFIPQEPMMFHRSLLENIRYGKPQASDEEVIAAARLAHCEDFIADLPQKYQTLVGERGTKLSGGQRQRIAIARALLKNAPILILDEATSALDSITEKYIQDGLSKLMPGRTTIVIAHRLSTLVKMDRILVFQQGAIIEDGSHADLIGQNGHYAKLWRMQSGGLLPEQALA